MLPFLLFLLCNATKAALLVSLTYKPFYWVIFAYQLGINFISFFPFFWILRKRPLLLWAAYLFQSLFLIINYTYLQYFHLDLLPTIISDLFQEATGLHNSYAMVSPLIPWWQFFDLPIPNAPDLSATPLSHHQNQPHSSCFPRSTLQH